MNLSNKAMLVRLSISQWSARKFDATVTDDVKQKYKAHGDIGRFNKVLVAQDAIKQINQVGGEARSFHYSQTLPWEDEGIRILPAANFFDYSAKIREFHGKFDAKVEEFIGEYPALVEDAKTRLNGMFKESDYPRVDELRTKYSFDMHVSPIMSPDDFRVKLNSDDVETIQQDIEDRLNAATAAAMKDLWQRLYDAVSHVADRLNTQTKGKDVVFRDSLIENAREIVKILPRLNLTDNQELEQLRAEVEKKICAHDPEMIRSSKTVKNQVSKSADEIMRKMAGYM